MNRFAYLILGLVLVAVPLGVNAGIYPTREDCSEGGRRGHLGSGQVLECFACMQEGGQWEYEQGESYGVCRFDNADRVNKSEAELRAEGYQKTNTTCSSANGVTNSGCGGGLCVSNAGSDEGYCYAKPTGLINLLKFDTLPELLDAVLGLMIQVGTLLLVLFLVLTGFKFVSAQGNAEKVESARNSLTWVVIGGMLLLGAQALSMVISAAVESL